MTKIEWISQFRNEAEHIIELTGKYDDKHKKTNVINREIKLYEAHIISEITNIAQIENWHQEKLLNEILLITYASYIVMLEYRNKVWKYDYMSFSRRVGEIWEPFCKLTFQYHVNKLKLIEPPKFEDVQLELNKNFTKYVSALDLSMEEKRKLSYYYGIPWTMVGSGGIKLELDLHFEKDGIHYNCDFKSGFNSNEKGNVNRLLLVGSIYDSIGENEKNLLFVRQNEVQNNHYLQTLKDSPYWSCYCADECYSKMEEFTGFNLRKWIDCNIDWKNDISAEFRKFLTDSNLISYLTW